MKENSDIKITGKVLHVTNMAPTLQGVSRQQVVCLINRRYNHRISFTIYGEDVGTILEGDIIAAVLTADAKPSRSNPEIYNMFCNCIKIEVIEEAKADVEELD